MKRTIAFWLSVVFVCLVAPFFRANGNEIIKGSILKIDFEDKVNEKRDAGIKLSLDGLKYVKFFSIMDFERIIARAADDPSVGMIFISADSFDGNLTQAEEIRNTLEKFKASGKPIISYITNTDNYYLASVADTVCLNPSGDAMLKGMYMTSFYFGDLLDSLDIGIQTARHGKYKSAIETYTRNSMSKEDEEQNTRYLSSVWENVSAQISSSRNIDNDLFQKWVNELEMCSPENMLNHGLVDKLFTRGEMEQYLYGFIGGEKNKKKIIPIWKYWKKSRQNRSLDMIAVINATGTLTSGETDESNADQIVNMFIKARKNPKIKAVVFRVSSPGGEVYASDLIRQEMIETKKVKPVIASYGQYAASGGYWISSECNYIFTNKSTITGSIGVFLIIPEISNMLNSKLHIGVSTINTNQHSDMLSGTRELTQFELGVLQNKADEKYTKFVELVSAGRGITYESVDSLAGGRIWSGADAVKLGLADAEGTLLDAVEYAAKEAGLSKYAIAQLIYYPPSLLTQIKGKKDRRLVSADISFFLHSLKQSIEKVIDGNAGRQGYAVCPMIDISF